MRTIRPPFKRRPTNVTLSRKTLAILEAFARWKASDGEMAPTRTWMIEQGVDLFLEKMANKYPGFRPILKGLEAQFKKMEEHAQSAGSGGVLRSIAGRAKRK